MNRNDDQWFEIGQKVVRVSMENYGTLPSVGVREAEIGPVYCVADFFEAHEMEVQLNWIHLVGFPTHDAEGDEIGYPAANFRRVEEIQLCVKAAEMMKKPKEEAVPC